jgi:hypothetical protein
MTIISDGSNTEALRSHREEPLGLPFTVSFVEQNYSPTQAALPALQTYAAAVSTAPDVSYGKWLVVGGRLLGIHPFLTPPPDTFPFSSFNHNIFVIDPITGQQWSFDLSRLPFEMRDPLAAIDQAAYFDQAAGILNIIGGYGLVSTTGAATTFPTLTRVPVAALIREVMKDPQNPAAIKALIAQVTNPNLAVAGAGLRGLNGHLVLVGGQKFIGDYQGFGGGGGYPYTQVYTEEIRIMQVADHPIAIRTYAAIGSQDEMSHPYHRRDLNAVTVVDPATGRNRVAIFGGVFRPGMNAAYQSPIYIDDTFTATTDTRLVQQTNLYECATIQIWDAPGRAMHCVFFGGIGRGLTQADPARDDGMPYSNQVSMVSYTPGVPQPYQETVLGPIPGNRFLGSDARFIVNADLIKSQVIVPGQIVDLAAIPRGTRALVGYVYGGIESTGPQEPQGTSGSNSVFQVWVEASPSTATLVSA